MSKKITDILATGTLDKKEISEIRSLDKDFRQVESYYGTAFTEVQEHKVKLDHDLVRWTKEDGLIKNKHSQTIAAPN